LKQNILLGKIKVIVRLINQMLDDSTFSEQQRHILQTLFVNTRGVVALIGQQDITEASSDLLRHKLGNLMTPLRGYADVLVHERGGPLTDQQYVLARQLADEVESLCAELKRTVWQPHDRAHTR